MKEPRFRIAWVMVIVALAALNFTAIRAVLDHAGDSTLMGVGALPMANVLAVGLLKGYWSRRSRRFLQGFEIFGAMALAAYIAVAAILPHMLKQFLQLATVPYIRTFVNTMQMTTFHLTILYCIGVVIFGVPQLAFALIGGCLFRRLRTAER